MSYDLNKCLIIPSLVTIFPSSHSPFEIKLLTALPVFSHYPSRCAHIFTKTQNIDGRVNEEEDFY